MKFLYEGPNLSLTRTLAFAGFVLFVIVTLYLVLKGQNWAHYDTFAAMTGGGSAATQIGNKLINSKYNSPLGEVYKK